MKQTTAKYKYNNILLIDDSELDNFINEKMIEANFYAKKIYVSTNGKSALEFINNLLVSGGANNGTYPEVMFVDLNMPLMDGFEFIAHFKKIKDPKLLSCKIVILTSSVSNSDKVKVNQIGTDIVLVHKPLTNQILAGI
ncbi:MAG TPA: response regulator [Flavobacteriales bacterium]|nr:response regulator [Flavobacteriales bacterium]